MTVPILVTGVAGFIGFHLAQTYLERGRRIVGLDNLSPYYDVRLKRRRLELLLRHPGFRFVEADLTDAPSLDRVFESDAFELVVNLAAQAGVRYSLRHPQSYVKSNIEGFVNLLEACRRHAIKHLLYASSSSVYGGNTALPFSERQNVDHPISLYAATKKSNELLAHSYSHLFGLPTTGLRFFTVYGPWNRPDMAIYLFAQAIASDSPIQLFNQGRLRRDFTFVDDIVEGMIRLAEQPARPDPHWNGDHPDPASSDAPWRIYNMGSNNPIDLSRLIELLEINLGRPARTVLLPMQPGDVPATCASVDDLQSAIGFRPSTTIEDGVARFCDWFRTYEASDAGVALGSP